MGQVKKYNKQARILGLDIGRKYTGIALSCKELILAKGFKTLMMPSQTGRIGQAQEFDAAGLYQNLKNIIKNKQVKGIVVGYPLDKDGSPAGKHNRFIEDFLAVLAQNQVFGNIPITLVNEYDSTM